jgi:hypothetical protein
MAKLGALLIVVGIAAFILPLFDMQLTILSAAGDKVPYIAGGAIVLGLILGFAGRARGA